MSTALQRTSTASSKISTSRRIKFFAPPVIMTAAAEYPDFGNYGINNSGLKSSILTPGDLGWSVKQTKETRAQLAAFEEDWLAPGMEAYDDL